MVLEVKHHSTSLWAPYAERDMELWLKPLSILFLLITDYLKRWLQLILTIILPNFNTLHCVSNVFISSCGLQPS